MSSAKLYVSTNVVDRLTKPIAAGSESNKRQGGDDSMRAFDDSFDQSNGQVIDAATYIGSLQSATTTPSNNNSMQISSNHRMSTDSINSGDSQQQKDNK